MENQPANRTPEDDDDGSDRISQLPESVLLHILCFLSQKKAVQTCVLSKSWRHLGSTRPVIDLLGNCDCDLGDDIGTGFCEDCFYGNKETFMSVVDSTFQRYHLQNISVQELRLEVLDVDSQSISLLDKWIPLFVNPNRRVTTFRLSVENYILYDDDDDDDDQKPDRWTCFDLPSVVFKAESLETLYLDRCKINSIENALLKNLQRLSLSRVHIADEALNKIISSCPLVEYVDLDYCHGLKTVSITNANQCLTCFKFTGCCVKHIENYVYVVIDAPTLQSIRIERYSNWRLNSNSYFPHLKSLYLLSVQLSTKSFNNFSCKFPLLEDFSLFHCSGFEEINIFSRSIKKLDIQSNKSFMVAIDAPHLKSLYLLSVQLSTKSFDNFSCKFPLLEDFSLFHCSGFEEINIFSRSIKKLDIRPNRLIKLAIDAPYICSFKFSGSHVPTTISFTETSGEWKSHIDLDNYAYDYDDSFLVKLHEMVKALTQSQISLTLFQTAFFNEKQIGWGFNDPVEVEHFRIMHIRLWVFDSVSFTCFINTLLCIIRPRFVSEPDDMCTDEVAECIWKTLAHGKEKREHCWQQHLKEVTVEVSDFQKELWHEVEWTSFRESASSMHQRIRFQLEWID